MLTAPIQKLQHAGSSYYADCPYCGKTNWLSWEKADDNVLCKKCTKWFKLVKSTEEQS
jgi:hypothetical protein